MQQNERTALLAYIADLSNATAVGKISWRSVNPTTFVWEAPSPQNARLSLQRVERVVAVSTAMVGGRPVPQQKKQTFYLIQAFDQPGSATPIMNVDSSDDIELNQRLSELFELIKTGVSEKTLEFLRSMLPK